MLKNVILNIQKGMRKVVNDNILACKEVLSSAQNRLIIGLILFGLGVGLGGGLIASAFIHV